MKKILSLLALLMLCVVGANAETVKYALAEEDTFTSGQTVEVKNGDAVVATITYGESGGADFKAAKANGSVSGYTAFTEGNGTNGNKTGGTFYTITPKVDATISVAVVLNADKAFFIEEDGTALEAYNGITVAEKYYGTYEFEATANKAYKVYCAGSKLGFFGFEMTPAEASETYAIGANVNGMGANMDLTLAENTTLPYTATFADCYRGAMGSEPNAAIQIQNAVVTSGTNVTIGTLNGWDTTFTISEEGTSVISLTLNMGAMTITVNVTKYIPAETKTFSLVPGEWDKDGARFAAWTWSNEEDGQWIDFTKVDDAYTISIPANNTGLILARMNGETTENNWNEGTLWNKTGDIDITDVPDNSVFTITGWGESDYTISPAATPLDAAKAALQAAIDKVKAFGLDGLADVIAAAEAAVAAEDATIESVTAAAAAFQDGVKTYVMGVLTTLKQYMSTFSGAAAEALKEDFEKLEADINSNDIDAVKTDIASLMVKGSSYLQADIVKLEGYAAILNNEAITADVAAMKAALEAGSFAALLAAVEKFKADFLAEAPNFVERIEYAAAGYKDAGKTHAMEQLEAAIAAAKQALAAEDATIVTVGLAIRNLIVAVQTHLAANSTYTIAGTKNLTGTENDWDIVEANNMTKSAEDYMYEWTAENITVTAENQPQFKVVITDIDGTKQTWIPASEEGDDHNWVITPDVVGGEGVFNITITFNAKTQEIGVAGEKVEVEGIIADGTYYVMNAAEGTLINAEGALDAKGSLITFTFDKANNAYTIEGADYFTGKQWTVANAIEGISGYYTISTPEGFLAANATALEQIADGTADAAVWILLEKAYWEDIVNSTYTVAGTKNLTDTGNDWDIDEANQMTYNDETQLYEKKFKRIAIDAENQPEFKVVQTNMAGENIWYPENNWVITTDYVGGEGLYDITITFDPSDFKEIGVIAEKRIVFPENAIVYDFEAAADASENPANKNGSAANGQAFFGWENPEKTDSKRQDYKGYEWAEGSLLPEVCHVWRRSDRINGNVAGNGGLKCPSNKEMAIDGLNEGDKVIIVYDAENATDKEIIWAIGDGTSEGGPGTVRATATIGGVEAVTGETTIASGAEIVINSVTPAENGTGYIVLQVKKGMIIQQIAVIPSNLNTYTATFTTNAGWEKVYAYAWSGDGESAVKFLGDWPGKEMTPGNGGNDWMISFKAEAAPEKIIFNNGDNGAQTADLVFEDGKAYEFTINNEWADAIAAAQALAEEDGVAVGKLIAAIGEAQGIAEPSDEQKAALQTAVDQYKLDNADQEKDETAKVATNGWKKFDGSAAGVCATQFAPAITTYDGRTAQMAECYETNGNRTGTIIYQDITGLTNGKYKVGFYGNAFSTSQRDGFECTMEDGATDVAYVFANEEKEYISARIATSTTENDFRQFDVEVTDGNIKLGMGKDTEKSTNWHTIQIYQLTWFTTAKEVFAQDQEELKAVIAEAKALLADETKTEGKEALEFFVYAAEQAVDSKMINISELEAVIGNLKDIIAGFKKANWYIDFAAGEYYIIDVESGLKMAAGHDWGTRGIVNERGLDLTLTPYTESRTVTIDSRVYNGDTSHFLGENLYMDSSEWGWALEYQGFGFYILEPNGGKYINLDKDNNLVLSDTPREFIIVTKDGVRAQLLEELSEATKDAPVDATGLIVAQNFNRNDARNAEAWIVSEDCTNKNLSGGNNVNNCAESFHSTFTIMQTISDAPAGFYQLTAQGFYRQDEFEGDAPAAPQFFANEVNADVPAKTGSENGMSDASASFTNGLYTIEPINFEVKDDGMMYIGITASTNTQWVIWDNFQLKYFGVENPTTGISNVVVETVNDGAIYNLNGQKVQNPKKGLYIINGRKQVVK